MTHEWKKVAFLGVLVALTPLLGVPRSWKDLLIIVFGVALVILGLVMRVSGTRERTAGRGAEQPKEINEPARTA